MSKRAAATLLILIAALLGQTDGSALAQNARQHAASSDERIPWLRLWHLTGDAACQLRPC